MWSMPTSVDKRAVVSPKAQLGDNVCVGPFTIIEDDVVIGDGTRIAANALIANGARIGRNCLIHHAAVVSNPPQDLKYAGEETISEIGDGTVIREFVTIHRGTAETGKTVVGKNCLLMANVHIAHDCRVGDRCILANVVALGGHVTLGDWVTLGGLTPVHQFGKVGSHAMVGGGFRVTQDVPPYALAARDPLRYEGVNVIGLRRRGFSQEQIETIEKAYFVLYSSGLLFREAIDRIENEFPHTNEITAIVSFLRSSSRGIIRK
jgi:UDP-N-acetylglucosamine acyltransferase